MDSASAAAGIRLWHGGSQVAGEIRLTPDALAVEFIPAVALSPGTDYELRVDASVRDVLGSPIAETASAPFQTEESTATIGALSIIGHRYPRLDQLVTPTRLAVGQSIDLYASTGGLALFNSAPVHWTSSAPSIVHVTERSSSSFAIETGMRVGSALVTVEAAGFSGSLLVEVFNSVTRGTLAAAPVYVDRYNSVWRQRADGADAVKLFDASELPADSTLCVDNITASCYWSPHMFAVSPTGGMAVTRASDIGGVWIKEGVGGALRQVNAPGERGAGHSPAWSPSGDRLAYWFDVFPQAITELRVVNFDGSGQRVLARVPYETSPPIIGDPSWASRTTGGVSFVWHPDGERLLIASPEGTVQTRIDGSGTSPYLNGYQPGPWFPDGQVQFVFQQAQPPKYGNRVFRATGEGVVDVDSGFDVEYRPIDISPDGLFMADLGYVYTMNRSALTEVTGYQLEHLIGFAR